MKTPDRVVRHGNSIVQHGHFNNRVYVMKLDPADIPEILRYSDTLAYKEGYSKIFVKVPESSVSRFMEQGYIPEATVPFFYRGKESAVFMAKYTDPARRNIESPAVLEAIVSEASAHAGHRVPFALPPGCSVKRGTADDAEDIAALYRMVFKTYPFPVSDPGYITESMQGHVHYYVIRNSHLLAAVASCDIDPENRNAELTDFASNPLFRGRGFAGTLLDVMEIEMKNQGVSLAYTIARAQFQPINMLFAAAGYRFAGMLPNNTNICGAMESMNVWYKKI